MSRGQDQSCVLRDLNLPCCQQVSLLAFYCCNAVTYRCARPASQIWLVLQDFTQAELLLDLRYTLAAQQLTLPDSFHLTRCATEI